MAERERRHVIASPCQWCGAVIEHARGGGRRRQYCGRNCQQRAYEARTAARRAETDVAAGRINVQPGERVIEIVTEPQFPTGKQGWERMLQELISQARNGHIDPLHARRLAYLARTAANAIEPAKASKTPPTSTPAVTASDPIHDIVKAEMAPGINTPTTPSSASSSGQQRNRKRRKRRKR